MCSLGRRLISFVFWQIVVIHNGSLRARFHTLASLHGSGPIFVSRITLSGDEGNLSPKVGAVDSLFPSISVHMFPDAESEDMTIVWIQGKNFEQQQAAVDAFLDMVDEDEIYDVYEEHLEGDTVLNQRDHAQCHKKDEYGEHFAIS